MGRVKVNCVYTKDNLYKELEHASGHFGKYHINVLLEYLRSGLEKEENFRTNSWEGKGGKIPWYFF